MEGEMCGVCSAHGEMRYVYKFSVGKLEREEITQKAYT
jgi:hypothetical protein